MDADLVFTRGTDLVVLGARLRGFEVSADDPAVVVAGPAAQMVLVLPPQHVLEETTASVAGADFVAAARLAGPSRVAYQVSPGTRMRLDVAGVLDVCRVLGDVASMPGDTDTLLELPWRLAFSPSADGGIRATHAIDEVSSAEGIVGMWSTRLTASSDELALRPVDPSRAKEDAGFTASLTPNDRAQIVALGETKPPRSGPITLTALGGSLAAHGEWDGFRWAQRVTNGRDEAVLVEEQVRCYPFGHRGVLSTVVERDPDFALPDGSTVAPGGTLSLRRVRTLRIIEPTVPAPDGQAFGRAFPFAAVELLTSRVAGLGEDEVVYRHTRPTPGLDDLKAERAEDQTQADGLQAQWTPLASRPRTMDDLINEGFEPALQLANLNAQIGPLQDEMAQLQASVDQEKTVAAALADAQRALDQLISGTPASEDGSVSADIAAAQAAVSDLVSQENALAGDVQRFNADAAVVAKLQPQADAAFAQCQPRLAEPVALSVDDLAAQGVQPAIDWLALQPTITDLTQRIDALTALATTHDVIVWPTQDGQHVAFEVALHRKDQTIHVTMPLLLVKDFVLTPQDPVPGYVSLQDPDLPAQLDQAWTHPGPGADVDMAGAVDVPGVQLDVVGSAQPKPEDVQIIRALNISGGRSGDPFSPTLGRDGQWALKIDLPALRSLLGPAAQPAVQQGRVAVAFADDFLNHGETAAVLFRAVDTQDLAVDFTSIADRCGGLAALQIPADAVSRASGPVQAAALAAADPKKLIGDRATLLGLKLQDLIGAAPEPPSVVSDLAAGTPPVITMAWKDVVLNDLLVLSAYPNRDADANRKHPDWKSRLNLEVVSSPDRVSTSGEVTQFGLIFPPSSTPLLRVDFATLGYRQVTAAGEVGTPRVTIDGLDLTFLGPLALLKELEEAAALLGGDGPSIQARQDGVVATLNVPLPSVQCGAFTLSNISFNSTVDIPFTGKPVSVSIGFASRSKPFAVSVLAFGGGGYVEITMSADGPRIEASLEFGALISVDFVVASGEVHALGGARYVQHGTDVELTGYLRIGGSVDVLGLVSASIELVVQLAYDTARNVLAGRATLVLEIDLTLWSDSVEIDSGEWVLQGGDAMQRDAVTFAELPIRDADALFAALSAPPTDDELTAWRAYRRAFEAGGTSDE